MKWLESNASKGRWAKWVQPIFGSMNILWDGSTPNVTELVGTKDGKFAYLRHETRGSDTDFNNLSDDEKAKRIALEVELFEDISDFRSFIEVKNDNRLRKLVV